MSYDDYYILLLYCADFKYNNIIKKIGSSII